MRQQAADSAFLLSKMNGDSFLFVRVLGNAFMPYQTWNYPTQASNDYISRSLNNSNNELIEVTQQDMLAKCPNATSCVIVIGVTGSSVSANSQYSLTLLGGANKVSSNSAITRNIMKDGGYDYYWFTVSVRPQTVTPTTPAATPQTAVAPSLIKWNHLIILG